MNERQIGLLTAFLEAGVDFVIVGGMAVILHGYLRTTKDLDVFIRPTEDNARICYKALVAVGAAVEDLEPNDLLNDEEHFRFGPSEDYVDILTSIGEMPFEQVWRNRVELEISGLHVPFISKTDLIDNKLQVGRLRDLSDAEELNLMPDIEI